MGSAAVEMEALVWRGMRMGAASIVIALGWHSYAVVVVEYSFVVGSCSAAAA